MYQSQLTSIVIRLKKAKNNNPEFTIDNIVEATGVSKSTVSRIFADNSENQSFRYESLKPLCLYLLGTDGLDEEIDADEMQMRLAQLKDKYESKLEKEKAQSRASIEYLKHQILKKDERIDYLMRVNELLITQILGAKNLTTLDNIIPPES